MKESMDIIGKAKKEYDLAAGNLSAAYWHDYNLALSKMLDIESEEYASWTSAVRALAYSTATGVTIGMVFADIFGCLGFCSGIVTSTTWGTAVAATESTIAL